MDLIGWLEGLWLRLERWARGRRSPWDEPGPHDHYQGGYDDHADAGGGFDGGGDGG